MTKQLEAFTTLIFSSNNQFIYLEQWDLFARECVCVCVCDRKWRFLHKLCYFQVRFMLYGDCFNFPVIQSCSCTMRTNKLGIQIQLLLALTSCLVITHVDVHSLQNGLCVYARVWNDHSCHHWRKSLPDVLRPAGLRRHHPLLQSLSGACHHCHRLRPQVLSRTAA